MVCTTRVLFSTKCRLRRANAAAAHLVTLLCVTYSGGVTSCGIMARRKRSLHMILGVLVGILFGHLLKQQVRTPYSCTLNSFKAAPTWEATTDPQLSLNESVPDKTLLFVGVMTAAKYLETRAKAVYRTWGSELPGKIAFFSSEVSRSESVPLVSLKNVDDSYPPQKKSFMMLQYMHEHFGDKFEWFLRADDDVYIRTERLEVFLRSINSKKPQFIGQAGRGNNEEFGLLSLEYDENFCMGGPGVILSRETLKRIAPHISYCLKNLYTTHEDVELGRCVQKFAGIPCTWSYEMQSILYHNQSGSTAFTGNLKTREVHRAITMHPIKQPAYMYRLHNYFRELKIQALKQTAVELHREIRRSQTCLGDQMEFIAEEVALQTAALGSPEFLGDSNLLGAPAGLTRHHPQNIEDILTWDFISKSLYSAAESNPRRRIDSALKEGIEDVIREVMETINMYSKQRGRIIDFREVLYAYTRLDPLHGVDWVLDLLLVYRKYRGHKMTVPVRRHAYVQQTFTGMEIREIPLRDDDNIPEMLKPVTVTLVTTTPFQPQHIGHKLHRAFYESFQNLKNLNILPSFLSVDDQVSTKNSVQNKVINFILPLAGRFETFQRFMNYFEEVCLRNSEPVKLIIILYLSADSSSDYNRTVNLVNTIHERYPHGRTINLVKMLHRPFSRGEALQIGVSECYMNDLLFFVDVDMIFNAESLMRIRLNTIRKRQVYFPIVFSEYDPLFANTHNFRMPDVCNTQPSANISTNLRVTSLGNSVNLEHSFIIHDNRGYWRLFGFGIASVYRCDFEMVGGFNTSIQGWGLEDVSLFEKLVKSNLRVFRAPDVSLVHVFHHIDCSPDLSEAQRQMCLGSRANTLSSTQTLYQHIMTNLTLRDFINERSARKPGT